MRLYYIDRSWQLSPSLVGGVRLTELSVACTLELRAVGGGGGAGSRLGGGNVDLGNQEQGVVCHVEASDAASGACPVRGDTGV